MLYAMPGEQMLMVNIDFPSDPDIVLTKAEVLAPVPSITTFLFTEAEHFLTAAIS